MKPRKDLKHNFGAKVQVSVAIAATKTVMCHVVAGNWTAAKAAKMYNRALAPSLKRAYPGRSRFLVLEDNDPTGYKSDLTKAAKRDNHVVVFEIPKRSPDLNPLG